MPVISVDPQLCDGCGQCVEQCPTVVLVIRDGIACGQNSDECMVCQTCETVCVRDAIRVRAD